MFQRENVKGTYYFEICADNNYTILLRIDNNGSNKITYFYGRFLI